MTAERNRRAACHIRLNRFPPARPAAGRARNWQPAGRPRPPVSTRQHRRTRAKGNERKAVAPARNLFAMNPPGAFRQSSRHSPDRSKNGCWQASNRTVYLTAGRFQQPKSCGGRSAPDAVRDRTDAHRQKCRADQASTAGSDLFHRLTDGSGVAQTKRHALVSDGRHRKRAERRYRLAVQPVPGAQVPFDRSADVIQRHSPDLGYCLNAPVAPDSRVVESRTGFVGPPRRACAPGKCQKANQLRGGDGAVSSTSCSDSKFTGLTMW